HRAKGTIMDPIRHILLTAIATALLAACGGTPAPDQDGIAAAPATDTDTAASTDATTSFSTAEIARFDSPWAMTFLPDGRLLVTEMGGTLKLYDPAANSTGTISGVPAVEHVAQGGLGDVVLHPQFADNQWIYISYVERDDTGLGAAVARARLALDDAGGGALQDLEVIWRQTPKKSGDGHFGYRIAFAPDGKLFISSSERKEFDPAQDMAGNLGKIVRLNDDGTPAEGNPFADQGGVAAQVWSLGHRNILGVAFAADGQLWAHEMGPKGGDELNLVEPGQNYGYPVVSDGNHYDDTPIPDHAT